LVSSKGQKVRPRCHSPNLCDYCGDLALWEEAELLALDAEQGTAPSVWAVLGTRSTSGKQADFYRAREHVMRAVKRRWPDVEYWCKFEMTTGYGRRSGGRRRPHWNLFLKNVPIEDVERVRDLIVPIWCARHKIPLAEGDKRAHALAEWQSVKAITNARGLSRYITVHFGKESQAPPKGWKGQRATHSRGYLWKATADARAEAKEAISRRRALWRAKQQGLEGHEAELAAAESLREQLETTWSIRFGDGSEESHFLYEADRVREKLGGWRGARTMPPRYRLLAGQPQPAQAAQFEQLEVAPAR
jgi:hypothetical protein